MPTYEYRCESCDARLEVFAAMSDPPPENCEQCGASSMVRVLFAPAVHYKGSGFYATDYAGSKSSSSSSSSSEGSSKGSDTSSSSDSSTKSSSDTPSSPST